MVEVANQRGTADNLTVGVFTMLGETASVNVPRSVWQRIGGFFRRS
jgi:hypothetical protein